MDKPSGDIQILSAARACFDVGDYECASNYYSQLSSASSDQSNSEAVFQTLAQNGVSVSAFMDSVISGSSEAGKLVTNLSTYLIPTSGESARLAFFHAFQKQSTISDSRTQGLIRFITSLSLLSELLAEDADTTKGKLQQADLVSSPTGCADSTAPLFSGCEKPTGKKIVSGAATIVLKTATDAQMSGSPSLQMINAAAVEIEQGLSQMQTSGSLGSSSSSFTQGLLNAASAGIIDGTDSPAYRKVLIQYNVGVK
jgi:hypothetical protein